MTLHDKSEDAGGSGLRGALRIERLPPAGAIGAATDPAKPSDPHLAQLTKLFPAEAVSIYPAGAALLNGAGVDPWWFALLLLVAVVVVRSIATTPPTGGNPQYGAVGAAAISYVLWIVLLGDWLLPIGEPSGVTRASAGALAFIWAWIAPILVAQIDGAGVESDGR
jgi:hypothetical protein